MDSTIGELLVSMKLMNAVTSSFVGQDEHDEPVYAVLVLTDPETIKVVLRLLKKLEE